MTKGAQLRELEQRLRREPENLGLRVAVAGALHEAGRKADAVELYRSVAVAYRDQGRTQQAIAVCRSILEIAPDDTPCSELLATLTRPEGSQSQARPLRPEGSQPIKRPQTTPGSALPARPSSADQTPLPGPLPYHVADPTTRSLKKLSDVDLPAAEGVDTRPGHGNTPPPMDGIASAARRISAELIGASESYDRLDVSAELDTRQRPRIESDELKKISKPPPTAPVPRVEPADTEEELTVPREPGEMPRARSSGEVTNVREPITGASVNPRDAMLAAPFFAPLPLPRRSAVLARFRAKTVRAGESVIRQGDSDCALVIVGRGRLEVRAERANGTRVLVENVGAGDYIGEGALLTRTPAAAHVVAATDAELLLLAPHDFYEIAGLYPALWSQLKDVAERRARELAAKLR